MNFPVDNFCIWRGRCRAPGRATHRVGASLSVAADTARDSFPPGWCIRCRRRPWAIDEIPARHGGVENIVAPAAR